MKNFHLILELYEAAFRAIGHFVVRHVYKLLFWFCFFCYLVVLYAFLYRIATGFAFD